MDILRADVPQVNAVYLRGNLHISPHSGQRRNVFHPIRNLEHPAAVADTQRLHRRSYRQAYRSRPPGGIRHDKIRGERVQPLVRALHGGKKAFQVYAHVYLAVIHTAAPFG